MRIGSVKGILYDRIAIFIKYEYIIKTAQIMFANNWGTINGKYSNEDCLLISYIFNYLSMQSKKENSKN